MKTFRTGDGPAPCVYIDGAEFADHVSGVFFALLIDPKGRITCSAVHGSSQDHMMQHDSRERDRLFALAAKTAGNDNVPLYDGRGHAAWID